MNPWYKQLLTPSLIGGILMGLLGLGTGMTSSAIAADSLTLRMGWLQTSIQVDDLETWTKTGEIPPRLAPYRWILRSDLQKVLEQRLHVDETVAASFLEQLWQSSEGKQLLEQLTTALPGSDPEILKATLGQSWQKTEDFSFLSFVRAYPKPNLTLDLGKITQMGVQLQSASLQGSMLRPYLIKAFQSQSSPLPPQKNALNPTQPGKQVVYLETLTLQDVWRKRRIPIDIYYSRQTSGSLVVMSHGFAADRKFGAYLARHLASHGFTVVSIEHPGSNIQALVNSAWGMDFQDILPASEFIERPQDVRFVLDRLERFNNTIPHFKGKLNTQQVTIIGHSFGGYTAFALGGATLDLKGLRHFCQQLSPLGRSPADWLQCSAAKLPYAQQHFRDPRIKQIIALNPIMGELFQDLSKVSVPSLILSSSDDGITPIVSHQLQPFQQLGGQKYLILAMGGTHMSVTDRSNLNSAIAQSTLVREVMGKEADPVREATEALSLAFLKQLSPEATRYQGFLSNDFIESLSTSQTQLYLTEKLPPQIQFLMNSLALGTRQFTHRSLPQKDSLITSIQHYLGNAKQMITRSPYCTRQVDDMLTALLANNSLY